MVNRSVSSSICLLFLLSILTINATQLKNFCYFTNWSNKLASYEARFKVSDINATMCSHLIYAFAKIDTGTMRLIPSENDDDNGQLYNKEGRYFDFTGLKNDHPDLLTLLSVGGANAKNSGFLQVVLSPENTRLFARNVAIYLRDRDFDGLDLDWEWPSDVFRNKFTELVTVMRDEFDKEAIRTSRPRLLLTIAVSVGEPTITESYNITEISKHVDYILVMAYDFHGPWSHVTSFSAPLYSRSSNPQFSAQLSQDWAIERWISGGAPREKLVMGLTGGENTFTLTNLSDAGVGAPVLGPAPRGPYLQRAGKVPYYRVCEVIRHGAVTRWDEEQKMAYAVEGTTWLGYGNPRSMREKVKYAYNKRLAGTMFWSLDLDDFKEEYCNDGRYPLLTATYDAILEFNPRVTTTHDNRPTSSTPSTTPIDFRKHHRTSKNGINYFDVVDNSSSLRCNSMFVGIISIVISIYRLF